MNSDNFTNEGFPSVGSVVHSVVEGLVAVRVVSGIVTGTDNLARFVTTLGTDDGTVVCKDDIWFLAGTRHFYTYMISGF